MGLTQKEQRWVYDADVDSSSPADGVTRKVLAYWDDAMCVIHHFKKDAVGALHTHPHKQITYVADGVFEFEIDGDKKVVKKGDSMYKESGVLHGCKCIEDGTLVDFFVPMREDFL